jgi:hypothetical protein
MDQWQAVVQISMNLQVYKITKCGEFIGWLNNYWLFKRDFALWS